MAYKFQLGPAILSGNLEQEGDIAVVGGAGGLRRLWQFQRSQRNPGGICGRQGRPDQHRESVSLGRVARNP